MSDPAYLNYWERKRLIATALPHFPRTRWWPAEGLCDGERLIFDAVTGQSALLDVGAGDLRVMKKLQAAGFRGDYHTQDIGTEYAYTYRDLADVSRPYGAVLCLNVIEHLPLRDGLGLLQRLAGLLAPGGVLVLQTPNARCVRQPLSWDMTHLHCYNAPDLWAYLTSLGLTAQLYRESFLGPLGPLAWLRVMAARFVATRLLGADDADNLLAFARRPA